MTDVRRVQPGDLFAERYRIERVLKAGGMGAVYVAEHQQTHRKLALKLMHPEIVADAQLREKFTQEAQVAALIDSPNIVEVLDAGVDPATGIPFIAMELLVGKELGQLLDEDGRLDPKSVVEYAAQVARGLDRAHAAGVVHRDLKPENLFLVLRPDEPPRVKILDFGIAKLTLAATPQTTRASGTPLYMAPEQAKRGAPLGAYTDVWAFGLIVYILLAGRPYWLADDVHGLYGEIFSGRHDPASARAAALGVTLPPAFDAWFARCVNVEVSQRFQSAGEAAARLADAFGIVLPTTSPTSPFASADPIARTTRDVEDVNPTAPTVLTPPHVLTPAGIPTPPSAPGATARPSASTPAAGDDAGPSWMRLALGAALGLAASAGAYVGYRHFAKAARTDTGRTRATAESAAKPERSSAAPDGHKETIARLALGPSNATCIVNDGGQIWCKGGAFGGKGEQPSGPVEGLSEVTSFAPGKHHACAVLKDATVRCWGDGKNGELGDGQTKRSDVPVKVFALKGAVEVAVSLHASCARLSDGSVSCWGGNDYGQRGDDETKDRPTAAPVAGIGGATQIAGGQEHMCALLGDGTVRCWGRNSNGQLGDPSKENHPHPIAVAGLTGVTSLSLGDVYSCARLADGKVECWGGNDKGELGDGTNESRWKPAPVPELRDVTKIVAGWEHACARDSHEAIYCWGFNQSGQLGDGTTTDRTVPVKVPGSFGEMLDAGREHTCAVRSDGVPVCWGRNGEGQLGDGTTRNRFEPVRFEW